MKNLLEVRPEGLYCKSGEFYIDAWSPVDHCIVTHAHSDHTRMGHQHYISTENTAEIILKRFGQCCPIERLPYGKKIKIKNCWVSLHPAGHILGSAQVRIESDQMVCVISGDYKRAADSSCEPFEVQECDIFVTESTFALPIYQWENADTITQAIVQWVEDNQSKGLASVLFCYVLGKAQRLLSLFQKYYDRPIYVHGSILSIADLYRQKGISLSNYLPINEKATANFAGELILAPPSAKGSPWMKRFYPYKTALASGWMQVRGTRRRKNLDRGFVISDHADWPDLLRTIHETKASRILTTHGNAAVLARYLQELNQEAYPLLGTEWMEEGEI